MKKRTKDLLFHRFVRFITRPFMGKPKYHFKEELKENAIIITNHNTVLGPLRWGEFEYDYACWGGYVYFDNKDLARKTTYNEFIAGGNPKWLAKIKAHFASNGLMSGKKGGHVISVYDDMRFYNTIKESIRQFKEGRFIIVFADDPKIAHSNDMKSVMPGALTLAKAMLEEGINPNIILAHQDKRGKNLYLDSPVRIKDYLDKYQDENLLLDYFKERINNLEKDFK